MASRKSPSQRDPMTRMTQAVRAGSPASMGGRVANASPVKAAAPTHRTVSPPGGGGILGYAEVYFYFNTSTTCDDSFNSADTSTIATSVGNHGVTVDGAGRWSYCTDDLNSLYVTTAFVAPSTSGTGPSASDVTSFWVDFGLATGVSTYVGRHWRANGLPGEYLLANSVGPILPSFRAVCTNPSIEFTASAILFVARMPAPT